MDALMEMGLNVDHLSDKMKEAMKFEDFKMVDGKVTSTRPLSAMRLKAIVSQAREEILEINRSVTEQLRDKPEDERRSDYNIVPAHARMLSKLEASKGGMNPQVSLLGTQVLVNLYTMVTDDRNNAYGAATKLLNLRNDIITLTNHAKAGELPSTYVATIKSAYDFYSNRFPELKQTPGLNNLFENFTFESILHPQDPKTKDQKEAAHQEIENLSKIPYYKLAVNDGSLHNAETSIADLLSKDFKKMLEATTSQEIKDTLSHMKESMDGIDIDYIKRHGSGVHVGYKQFISSVHDKLVDMMPELNHVPEFNDAFRDHLQLQGVPPQPAP